jgi:hypothetical protein
MATLNLPVSPPPIPAQPPPKRYRFGAAAGFAAALLLVVIGVDGAVPPYEATSPQPGLAQKQSTLRRADAPVPGVPGPGDCEKPGALPGCVEPGHGIPPSMGDPALGPALGQPGSAPIFPTEPGVPPGYGPGTSGKGWSHGDPGFDYSGGNPHAGPPGPMRPPG